MIILSKVKYNCISLANILINTNLLLLKFVQFFDYIFLFPNVAQFSRIKKVENGKIETKLKWNKKKWRRRRGNIQEFHPDKIYKNKIISTIAISSLHVCWEDSSKSIPFNRDKEAEDISLIDLFTFTYLRNGFAAGRRRREEVSRRIIASEETFHHLEILLRSFSVLHFVLLYRSSPRSLPSTTKMLPSPSI